MVKVIKNASNQPTGVESRWGRGCCGGDQCLGGGRVGQVWEQEEVEKGMKMKKVSMQAQPARVISKTRVPRMSKRRKTKIRRVPVERCKKKKKKGGTL